MKGKKNVRVLISVFFIIAMIVIIISIHLDDFKKQLPGQEQEKKTTLQLSPGKENGIGAVHQLGESVEYDGSLNVELTEVMELEIDGELSEEMADIVEADFSSEEYFRRIYIYSKENLSVFKFTFHITNISASAVQLNESCSPYLNAEQGIEDMRLGVGSAVYELYNGRHWYNLPAGKSVNQVIWVMINTGQITREGNVVLEYQLLDNGACTYWDSGIIKKAPEFYYKDKTNEELRMELSKETFLTTSENIKEEGAAVFSHDETYIDEYDYLGMKKQIMSVSMADSYEELPDEIKERGNIAAMTEKYLGNGYLEDELRFLTVEMEFTMYSKPGPIDIEADSSMWLYHIDENYQVQAYGYPDDCFITDSTEQEGTFSWQTLATLPDGCSCRAKGVYILLPDCEGELYFCSRWTLADGAPVSQQELFVPLGLNP